MLERLRKRFSSSKETETVTTFVPPTYPEVQESSEFYSATFKDVEYKVNPVGTVEQFREWFDIYTESAPCCEACERLIFPGPVAVLTDKNKVNRFKHFGPDCTPEGGMMFGGIINGEGQYLPAFDEGGMMSHLMSNPPAGSIGIDISAEHGVRVVENKAKPKRN